MQTRKTRAKPTKLEWTGGVLSSDNTAPVAIKGQSHAPEKSREKSSIDKGNLSGKLSIRVEKKGRAGKPVAILCGFSDPHAKDVENLKQLCSDLKNKLACGGTVEDAEIVLMTRDLDRLTKVLLESFGLDARRK